MQAHAKSLNMHTFGMIQIMIVIQDYSDHGMPRDRFMNLLKARIQSVN